MIVLVDCVLGLPEAVFPKEKSIRDLFRQASFHLEHCHLPAGRTRAADYFKMLLAGVKMGVSISNDQFPRRTSERIARSNSVFQIHPFQKNIQSGTYRIWGDLGQKVNATKGTITADMLHIWPQDLANLKAPRVSKKHRAISIAEGYPTYYWKNLFNSASREPKQLAELATNTFAKYGRRIICENWDLVAEKPDLADAAVLAMSAWILDQGGWFSKKWPSFFRDEPEIGLILKSEGWIAGVIPPGCSKD